MMDRIEMAIPFGTMIVHLETFFGEAKKKQIRGMLKLLRDRIVWCQSYCRQYETELKQAQRQVQRYQGCLGDVKAILEGGAR